MSTRVPRSRLAAVSTYPPRRYGLASYSADLVAALGEAAPHLEVVVVAVDRDGLSYPPEAVAVIDQHSYRGVATRFARDGMDAVLIQHEYGIFAFEAASLRGLPLVAVHAWQWPTSERVGEVWISLPDDEEIVAAEQRVLAEAVAGWRKRYPDVPVERRGRFGVPATVLADRAREASLLVVGSRGRGGFTGLLLGSTSQAVLHHATCPVAVSRKH